MSRTTIAAAQGWPARPKGPARPPLTAVDAPPAPGDEEVVSAPIARPGAHARNFGQLVGSHLGVALAGLVSLPVLARNLGPAAYGHFSLFMTTLGVLSNLDLARPILVRELARRGEAERAAEVGAARVLAVTSAHALAAVAFVVGALVQGWSTAAALTLAVLCHGASSAAYAELSARGQVGLAGSVRNGFWAAALTVTAVLSFTTRSPEGYVWTFAAANLGIAAVYQRLVGSNLAALRVTPRLAALRAHGHAATDIGLFAGASAVVASSDRLLLEAQVTPEAFGHYAAQVDLATKVNIISTALGTILLPSLARENEAHGAEATAARFVRTASWIALAYFVGLAGLMAAREPFAAIVLGGEFVAAIDVDVYALVLVGVFIHLFGFLLTSYQRARGDFRTQRNAYLGSATLMLVVGVLTIPAYGALGAVAAYLTGRTAELALIVVEVRRMPPSILPRWRVFALGAMLMSLAAGAWVAIAQGGTP